MFVKLQNIPPTLSLSTINSINSSPKLPPSILLHFVTGSLSAVILWLPDTSLYHNGNRAYSILLRALPCFPICLSETGHFLVTNLYGHADIITFLFSSSSPGAPLRGKLIIKHNRWDGCSAVNLRLICTNMTWLMPF